MKNLKNLLQYKYLYIILALMSLIYSLLITNFFQHQSKYNINTKKINAYIHDIKIDGNTLTLEVIGKEKLIGTYYFNTKEEKNNFKKVYRLGDYLYIWGDLNAPKGRLVFNLFSYKDYLLQNNIYYLINIDKVKKYKNNNKIIYTLKQLIINRIESINRSKHYLYAFILGEDSYISNLIKESYQINGISHLFAISGSNISLLAVFLLFLIKKLKIKYIILFSFLYSYMFITNFCPSIVRAGIFFMLLYINKELKLNIKTINILLLTLFISLITNPYLIYSVGFQFSFIISMYLILYKDIIIKYKSKVINLFIVSFIAFLTSIPIVLNNFYQINLLSVFFNLIFVPYVSIILFPLSLICFVFPFLDNILYILIRIMENTSIFFSKINIFTFIIGKPSLLILFLYYITITYTLNKFKHKKYGYIILILLIIIINYYLSLYNKYPEITFINIGQGDSILIKSPKNKGNILIDTGGIMNFNIEEWKKKNNSFSIGKNVIVPYLKSEGINHLDYLILTHGDYDHMGEAINLVENFKVENVIFNCGEYNDLEKELIKVLEKKNIKYYSCIKELNIDKYKLQFLNTGVYDNENDNSNVIYFNYNDYKFLFMGDAGTQREKDILEKYDLKGIDFLKVGHHGSNTSSSEEFINSINPKYSLISVGKNNRYGHPKESVLDTLSNSKIYRTDLDGSIEIKLNKRGYKIRTKE